MKPLGKRGGRQDPAHQVGLDEAWREEIVAARLPLGRVIGVAGEIGVRPFDDEL